MVGGVTCVGVIEKGVNYVYDWAQSDEDVQRMSRVAESHPVPVLGTSRHGKSIPEQICGSLARTVACWLLPCEARLCGARKIYLRLQNNFIIPSAVSTRRAFDFLTWK